MARRRSVAFLASLIVAAASPAHAQVSPPTLPPVVVEEPRLTPEQAREAERLRYTAPDATTATKTDTPIMDTPLAIQVLPERVLEDQGAVKAKDFFRNISGAQQGFDFGDNGDNLILRGFAATNLRNGLFANEFQTELATVERVEVLKGPAGALYGRQEPGGVLNFVTKVPLFRPQYFLEQQFGSFDFYRTVLDATGPLGTDTLAYRLIGVYENSDSFRDFVSRERVLVAPTLTWSPMRELEFIVDFQYRRDDTVNDSGIPAIGTRPAPLPISRNLSDGNNRQRVTGYLGEVRAAWEFVPDWKVRAHYIVNSEYRKEDDVASAFLDEATGLMDRNLFKVTGPFIGQNVSLDVLGKFATGPLGHTLLVGGDFRYRRVEVNGVNAFTFDNPTALPPIDIFNPVYGIVDRSAFADNFFLVSQDRWWGAYLQDQVEILKRLYLLMGFRYDWATSGAGFSSVSKSDVHVTDVTDNAFSPRFGVVYRPLDALSIYANYVEGLGINSGVVSASGQPLDPERGHSYEVGVKTDLWKGRLTGSLAYYYLKKENVAVADEANPGFFRSIGEQRSRGLELDLAGRVTDELSLTLAYAYTDAKILKDVQDDFAGGTTPGNTGNRPANIAKHAGSLWAVFRFPARWCDGWLDGLSMGGGVYAVSDRFGDNANSFVLPAYARGDAMVGYRFKLGPAWLAAQFNVTNLTDERYFATSETTFAPRTSILPGAPRSFLGTLSVRY